MANDSSILSHRTILYGCIINLHNATIGYVGILFVFYFFIHFDLKGGYYEA